MEEVVTYRVRFELEDKPLVDTTEKVEDLGEKIEDTEKKSEGLKFSLADFSMATTGIKALADMIGNVVSKLNECVEANQLQVFAETKLEQVMRNTLDATDEQIQSMKDLASELQNVGVVGDEVTLAGLGELSSYIYEDADSVKKLAPAMTDLIAYIDGFNASQGTAVSVAQMMGKVLEGETGALSRQGFIFDEAQEKVLKYGTEQERVAMLAEVIEQSVGGVNEALGATPEGNMLHVAMSFGDLKEQIGAVVVEIYNALAPALNWVVNAASVVVNFIRQNYQWLGLLAGVVLVLTVTVKAYSAIVEVVTTVTKIWAAAQELLNIILTANPIGVIIMAIVALIAIIVFLCTKVEGWGTLWDAICESVKESFLFLVSSIKYSWTSTIDVIMMGVDYLKKGWYSLMNLIAGGGYEDKLAEIDKDIADRKQSLIDGAKEVAEHGIKSVTAYGKVNLSLKNDKSLEDTKQDMLGSLGMGGGAGIKQAGAVGSNEGLSGSLSKANTSITDGGKQSKTFNITIGNILGENTNIFQSSSDDPESASAFMEKLANALQMVVNDVNYAAQ